MEKKIQIKAASSVERTLHPGSLPPGGFRKTANDQQYPFNVVNIGEIRHLYVPTFLRPAGGAITITGYGYAYDFDETYDIWCRLMHMFELV